MHKKSYLITILIALSTLHAADDQGLTAGDSIDGLTPYSSHSPSEPYQNLVRPNVPPELEPYVQETSTPGNFRIYVTFAQYEALKGSIQASGLSFLVFSDEELDLPRDPSQISAVSTLTIGQSQESVIQTEYSGSLQHLTQSPNPSL